MIVAFLIICTLNVEWYIMTQDYGWDKSLDDDDFKRIFILPHYDYNYDFILNVFVGWKSNELLVFFIFPSLYLWTHYMAKW